MHVTDDQGFYDKLKILRDRISRVSKNSISFIDFRFLRRDFGKTFKPHDSSKFKKGISYYIFVRRSRIPPFLAGKRVGIYVGNTFQSIIVKKQIQGAYFYNFVQTYKLVRKVSNTRFKLKKKR